MAANALDYAALELLVRDGRFDEVVGLLAPEDPADIADFLEDVSEEDRERVFMAMDPELAAEVLPELEEGFAEDVVDDISPDHLADIAEQMAPDDQADLLGDLDDDKSAEVLAAMEPEERHEVSRLLRYKDETAGGIMTSQFCALPARATVAEARQALAAADLDDPVHYIHVVREDGVLVGLVSLVSLLASRPDHTLEELADPDFAYATADEDREDVARTFRKYDLWVMPVVDDHMRLVGRITVDDILDVIQEEVDEDLAHMVGVSDLEYEEWTAWRAAGKRLPWLMITMMAGLVNSIIIKTMLNVTEVTAIAIFVPAILAMGGNTGIQSSTICIRGLMAGTRRAARIWSLVGKEVLTGLLLGTACGVIAGFIVGTVLTLTHADTGGPTPIQLALVVGVAMLNAMIFASVFGTVTPIVLDRFKIDPAVATGPFVTTSNDLSASLIYFLTCVIMLGATS